MLLQRERDTFRFSANGWWIGLLALLVSGVLAFAILQPLQVLPRMAISPGFALRTQADTRLTSEDLRGQIVLYNFTYTGCSAECPQTSLTMKALQAQPSSLAQQDVPVQLVTISFDPQQDTPAHLQAYATQLGADTTNWHFVTGDAFTLKLVIGGGFGAYYAQTPTGFTFDPLFVLVDGAGIIRARYRTATPALATLQRDIDLLMREAQHSRGALKYAYEAAHLFLCYPQY